MDDKIRTDQTIEEIMANGRRQRGVVSVRSEPRRKDYGGSRNCYCGGEGCEYFRPSGFTPGNARQCAYSNSVGEYGCPIK